LAETTILQHWLFTNFAFPFLLIFFIVFAILEKTKIFGEDKKQLNALLSFVVGLVFVSAVFPKIMVNNLILFLTVAIVISFIGLLLWGFLIGGDAKIQSTGVKWGFGIVLVLFLIGAVLWAAGWQDEVFDFLTGDSIGGSFWTNLVFIIVIAIALTIALKVGKSE
jgi:hypothetical protein